MKLLLLIFSVLIFTDMCDNQNIAIPDPVNEALKVHFPDAVDVEWEKEGEDFEAEFRDGNKMMEVLFDAEGNILKKDVEEILDDDENEDGENENEEDDD